MNLKFSTVGFNPSSPRPSKIRNLSVQAPLTHECLFALDQELIVSSAAPLTSLILVNRETLLQARLLSVTLYAVIFSLASVQSGGVAILRWILACLQAWSTVLLTLLLPLRRRAVVTTCLRKVKHRITASLRVPRLAVPPLPLTVSTRKSMFARMRRRSRVCRCPGERCDDR